MQVNVKFYFIIIPTQINAEMYTQKITQQIVSRGN